MKLYPFLNTAALALVMAFGPLAHAAADKENPEKKDEVRGAPLSAAPAQKAPDDAPQGAPTRVIPQSSLDLVDSAEGDSKAPEYVTTDDGTFLKLSFAKLGSYTYVEPAPDDLRGDKMAETMKTDRIPADIRALDGKDVIVVGFMVPIDVDRKGNISMFALTQNVSFCCYGVPPALNELLMVTMAEGTDASFYSDMPVAVYGKLEVNEEIEDGYVLSIYRMTANEVVDVRELLRRGGNKDGV